MSFTPVRFSELCEDGEGDVAPDLESVKALAARLKLQTRRPSYQEWTQRVQARPWAKTKTVTQESLPSNKEGDTPKNSVCGFSSVDDALEWLRKELREMQALDHQLARQLMLLRSRISQLKIEQTCERHKEMLDDATFDLEGCDEDFDLLCNIPPRAAFSLSTPLKHIGVTKMNINSRRFSLC
ncbi:PREDICTED: protein FAM167B [Nanorana parkeri]|uniref:protein FAM167B n=1 Tax=Nanorana parkeri TaxID=125878 RepID=UPI000854C989|nr:PREDICTED: protein FAM167B [Nanorana parkeri]